MGFAQTAVGNRLDSRLFAEDFVQRPYWWNAADPHSEPDTRELKGGLRADVAVIGSGFTGIVAALALARAGSDVVVIDADAIGSGAARRNAGMVGRSCRKSIKELTAKYGAEQAQRIYNELNKTMRGVYDLVEREQIDCHLVTKGRFVAANSKGHLNKMVKSYQTLKETVGFDYNVVRAEHSRTEVGSDLYKGGVVIPDLGSLHPGLLHAGLVRRAVEAGVRFAAMTEVRAVLDKPGHKLIRTSKGDFIAENVLIATNGYTPRNLKWAARRIIPFRAFMIATEELSPELIRDLVPHDRTYVDSFTNSEYFRTAPDSNRILFGGSTGVMTDDPMQLAAQLRDRLTKIFPQLCDTRLSNVWLGRCAVTFDFLPHFGQRNGVHYALGYNFSGINLATYFGKKSAKRILGVADEGSAFENTKFPTVPFYDGRPWFVPAVMRYYAYRDNQLARKG